ncbi:N-acetylmuramoyl-L-alanine amidase [Sulfurihydrogenibium yellowstonense]|jgi:N-acetylmuramoyl-L-alanine amidase|uniref:N-acetylmuramoyl-L-alanine amidase n=1 Tax=Sulfurihydrogenibium yellowstonense SS-5 TaxID=432331 RepID=C4FIL4_9AQUI|nr:N-acetylmuramoyl-L-alanine amidase [Sulfurihydrogenibium yellowstonense]EEP61095.1 N-acetylmuramoyl-L-alanine amidase [Sulfurihydrogenibium yellowstonense SS-5]
MKTLRYIFLSILIWVFYVEAFEIRTGIKDYGYRIVFDGVKNYEYLPVSTTLIFKIDGEFKNSAIKLDPRFVKSIEISKDTFTKKTIIYLEINDNMDPKVFSLSNPDRLVIDLKVLDKKEKQSVSENNTVKENKESKKVISKKDSDDVLNKILKSLEMQASDNNSSNSIEIEVPKSFAGRKKIIVIDPGHGGHDPGATANGLREKDINLKVALKLKSFLEKDPRFKVYLTREDDRFIPLYDRTLIAIEKKADLFISIHTNASENPNLSGTYIYTLNLRGATSKLAKMVEERENQTVLNVIKVSANPNVNKIVADMAISHTMTEGLNFAKFAQIYLKRNLKDTEFKRIESANFAVLKTPSIPSVLVETAFITNENDARLLANDKFLEKFAQSLYKAIVDYFFRYKNLVFSKGKEES